MDSQYKTSEELTAEINELRARIQALEDALEEAQQNLDLRDTILDRLPASVYVKDEQSRHIYANQEDLSIKGIQSRAEVINKTDKDFFSPDQADELLGDESHIIETGEMLLDKEETFTDKAGNVRVLSTTKLPWIDKSGQRRGIIGIGRDITWYKQEQDILNEINRQIVVADSAKTIVQEIVKGAMRLSKAASGIIFLVDTKEGDYQISELYRYPLDSQHPDPRLKSGEGITHEVIEMGHAVPIEDTSQDPRANPGLKSINIHALLALPLKRGKKVIGVFFVNYDKPREFKAQEIRDLLTMADYAVAALEKMRLMTEARESQRQISALHRASTALMASSNAEEIFTIMTQNAVQATGADWVSVVLIDRNRIITNIIDFPKEKRFKLEDIRPRPNGNSMAIFDSGQVYIVEDIDKEPEKVNPMAILQGFKSVVGLPLTVENQQQIGVLWLHYYTKEQFLPRQIASYELYARQGAMVYNNALRLAKMKEMDQITRAITNLIPLGDKNLTLKRIVDSVPLMVDCHSVTLFVYDAQLDELEHPPKVYGTKYPEETQKGPIVYRHSIVYKMLELEERYILEDVSADERFRDLPFVLREHIKSCLVMPLIVAGKKAGVMFINYDKPHTFAADELSHIQTFVDQAAIAVQNAQLLVKATDNANAFEMLSMISVEIARTQSIEEVLVLIANSAVMLTRATKSIIYLVDQPEGQYRIVKGYGTATYSRPDFNDLKSVGRLAMENRAPQIINGIQTIRGLSKEHPQLFEMGVESVIVLPLMNSHEKVLGVLYVYHEDYHRFTGHDQTILTTLSNDASIAIANELQRRERIGVVDDIANTIAGENDQKLVLQHILNSIQHIMPDLVFADIRLLDDSKSYLKIAAKVGEADNEFEDGIGLDYGVTGLVARTAEYKYVPDVHDKAHAPEYRQLSQYVRSELAVPMLDGKEVLGVLNVERPSIKGFTDTDILLIIAIAKLAVVAYQNVHRFKQLEEKRQQLEAQHQQLEAQHQQLEEKRQQLEEKRQAEINAINEMVKSIAAASKGPHETVQAILKWIGALTTVATVPPCLIEIIAIESYSEQLQLVEGWSGGQPHPSTLLIERRGIFRDVIERKQVKIIADVTKKTTYAQPRCDDARSQMVIPLIHHEEVYGLLSIAHPTVNAFAEGFRELGMVVGQMVMVAIDHARQHEDLKKAKGKIDGRTALMWMNLASSVWYHEIRTDVATIRNHITLGREDLELKSYIRLLSRFKEMDERAKKVLEKKEIVTIHATTEHPPENIQELLTNQLKRIKHDKSGSEVTICRPVFEFQEIIRVKVNAEWLGKALEILVNNGINATDGCEIREMRFIISVDQNSICIAISDTGKGMPQEIREALASEILPPYDPNKKGLGIGLLMVQAIADAFKGFLKVDDPDPENPGTTMRLYLPIHIPSRMDLENDAPDVNSSGD